MGNLNIEEATYGRDAIGINNLKNELGNTIQSARKSLRSENYQQVLSAINQYWSGPDAEKFKKELESSINTIDADFTKYVSVIDNALIEDYKQFFKMQQVNKESIGKDGTIL